MRKYTHKKGRHDSGLNIGYWIPKRKNSFQWIAKFTASCRYIHPDSDQWDWNKLAGVAFHPMAMRHSLMFGWRYNPDSDRIELAAYIHDGAGTENRTMLTIATDVKFYEPLALAIFVRRNEAIFEVNGEQTSVKLNKRTTCVKRLVSPWFGGQKAAPHDIEIYLKLK